MEIKLLKLYKHPRFLPAVDWSHTSSPTGEKDDIPSWWANASDETRNKVLAKRDEDENINAVGIIIAELPDVTIFCHSYNRKDTWFPNPQVIANENIKETIKLSVTKDKPRQGDMVLVHWLDASLNSTPATVKEITKSFGLIKVAQLGFLIHKNKDRVFVGGRFNNVVKKYRHLEAIPTGNILKMVKLKVK